MTDPIADMLTRIRNAVTAKHTRVDMPASRIKADIARILQDEGYIQGFKVLEETDGTSGASKSLRLFLNTGLKHLTFNDFLPPTFKTIVFGLIIGVISCFQGMRVQGGTEGVGRAATSSVVLSSLFIILADVVLVRFILVFFP